MNNGTSLNGRRENEKERTMIGTRWDDAKRVPVGRGGNMGGDPLALL
jgi:hypothetical protein